MNAPGYVLVTPGIDAYLRQWGAWTGMASPVPRARSIFESQGRSAQSAPEQAQQPASANVDLVSLVGNLLVTAFDHVASTHTTHLDVVLVGGYAHMSRFQMMNSGYRKLGSHEYGLRDIDWVLVPRTCSWDLYNKEADELADALDCVLNERVQAIKTTKHFDTYVEATQASSDYSVVSRKMASSFTVQRMLKSNEYGTTHVYRIDSHQLANVTVLSQARFQDSIEWDRLSLVFPAWRQTKRQGRTYLSRKILPVNVVCAKYLRERLSMQIKSIDILVAQGDKNAVKKKCTLEARRMLWDDPSWAESDARLAEWQSNLEAEWARVQDGILGREMLALQRELDRAIEAKLRIEQVLKDEKRRLRVPTKVDASSQTDQVVRTELHSQDALSQQVRVESRPAPSAQHRSKRAAMRTVECSTEPDSKVPLVTKEWDTIALDLWTGLLSVALLVVGIVTLSNCIGLFVE